MRRNVLLSFLAVMVMLSVPFAASALSADVEARVGGGLGLGSTTNPNETGSPSGALAAGVNVDLFLLSVGQVDLGISVGGGYSYLMEHGVINMTLPGPVTTTQTSDAVYNYLDFPVALVARIPLSDSLRLNFSAGVFFGYFLGGSANVSYNPQLGPPYNLSNGTVTLDSSTTEQWETGLHFSGGADIRLNGNLFLSPSIVFDMGLTNTVVQPGGYPYTDALWSLAAMIGIKYGF